MRDVTIIQEKLEEGFYGFWVKKRKVTFLLMMVLIIVGLYAAITIPKESTPDIKFGIISIATVYPGVDPVNIDALITQKIEKEIQDIDGVKKITSSSAVSISSVIVELENDVDINNALVDITDAVDKVHMPDDAEEPIVTEISSDNEKMFDVVLYASGNVYNYEYLKKKAEKIQALLEGKDDITKIDIDGGTDYDIQVRVDRNKAENIGLSLIQIAYNIRALHTNQPLGNHILGSLQYDFRIEGEYTGQYQLYTIPYNVQGKVIHMQDIATIYTKYKDERSMYAGAYNSSGFVAVRLSFNKAPGKSIFTTSDTAKKNLQEIMQTEEFNNIQISYIQDLSEMIRQDYNDLATNGGQTVLLVFLAMLLFVGLKESIIAAITIPLAFFITFIVLQQLGLSLNFLTNFSLIITFGIAIDTTIVIIEGAHEKMKIGYNATHAVLLAVKDYKRPLIASTATTCVAFLPMMILPGIMGKFLGYIPITIFITLLGALAISLTINSALYLKLSGKKKTYVHDEEIFSYLPEEERILLEHDRQGKERKKDTSLSIRERWLDILAKKYELFLLKFLHNSVSRLLTILVPVVILCMSFLWSKNIGFVLFPDSDSQYITIDITARKGTSLQNMKQHIPVLDTTLSSIPEIQTYTIVVDNEHMRANVELLEKKERKNTGLRSSFDVEDQIISDIHVLATQGLRIQTTIAKNGPPSGQAVGIKLIADTTSKLQTLGDVANIFEAYVYTLTGAKNVTNSNETSPGQFVFHFNKEKLVSMGLTPQDIQGELYAVVAGIPAGTIKIGDNDHTIKVQYADTVDTLSPMVVENTIIHTKAGPVRIGDVASYVSTSAISTIKREDTDIIITIGADVEDGITPDKIQAQLTQFASTYVFPEGISYEIGGETQENMELLTALGVAFIVAIILIYTILVLQFNSFLQPAIILYSVVMATIGVNIGLLLTGNAYSLAAMIGYIALTGIVVNDAIVFISKINTNKERGMQLLQAIAEAGKSRIQPIILTTVTTILGLVSVARQDEFFAGLAYTIMFGLGMGSVMTLFVLPVFYHDTHKITQAIKRAILSPIVYISIPIVCIFAVWMFLFVMGIQISIDTYTTIGFIVFGIYTILYALYTIRSRKKYGQTYIQKLLGIKICSSTGELMTARQVYIRFLVHWGLLVIPGITMILHIGVGVILYILLFGIHFTLYRISEKNQTIHDLLARTKVIDESSI